MIHQYTYQGALAASEKINWRVEDVIGEDKKLDFSRPFLPESLARVEPLAFLAPQEKLMLNQIRGHGYLYTFGLVEEFILPFVMDHARLQLHSDDFRLRALLRFAGEEAKHIHLFKRFREEFQKGFPHPCKVIGPPEEIARAVLSHDRLAVALTIDHIEWMTQRHYLDSIKDDKHLDEQFKNLLRYHWMEEAQHAKLDTLIIEAMCESCGRGEIDTALDEYGKIGRMLDGGLMQQVVFDMEALQNATGRLLNESERREFLAVQEQAVRWTYLGSGMTHPNFLATIDSLKTGAKEMIEQMAPAFC